MLKDTATGALIMVVWSHNPAEWNPMCFTCETDAETNHSHLRRFVKNNYQKYEKQGSSHDTGSNHQQEGSLHVICK